MHCVAYALFLGRSKYCTCQIQVCGCCRVIMSLKTLTVLDTLGRHLQLALLLLTEVKKGTNSTWHPYIHSLPSSVNTLLHWTDAQLQELQYSRSGHEQQFLEEAR